MFHFPRKSKVLRKLEMAQPRTVLTPEENHQLERLSRGHEGEKRFAEFLQKNLRQNHIPLYGIQINVSGSECQFDCLLILQHSIYLFEIKFHQGDYYMEGDRWFSRLTKRESRNPVSQLRRSRLLLHDFLMNNHMSYHAEAHLIFNHPNFYLYQAPLNIPIIFSGQLHQFIHQLNQIPSNLNQGHQRLAEKLVAAHISESSHERLPNFQYEQFKKGIVCTGCNGFMKKSSQRLFVCPICHRCEKLEPATTRTIKEFNFLFPEKQITVNHIVDWSDGQLKRRSVQRHLNQFLYQMDKGRSTYYRHRFELNESQ